MIIETGGHESYKAIVNEDGRLNVESLNISEQHHIAVTSQATFQVSSEIDIATSEKTILTLKNTHPTKKVVITFVRVMSIGAAAANSSAFFRLLLGGAYSSGGTAIDSVNLFVDSPVTATVESYNGNGTDIVMSGTQVEIDKNYEANSMQSYGKKGSIIIPTNSSISITHIGSTVAGKAWCRISYYMD